MAQPSNLYSVARVHALEPGLMDRMKWERMVDAPTPDDALRILAESGGYAMAMSDLAGPWEYEKVLEAELLAVKDLFGRISPDPALTDVFFLHHDVNNVKLCLTARHAGRDASELLSPLGTLPVEIVEQAFKEDDPADLPAWLGDAVYEIEQSDDERFDPQRLEVILDRAMYAQILSRTSRPGARAMNDYFRSRIDWINVMSWLRTDKAGFTAQYFSGVFIPGGTVAERVFWRGFDEGPDALLDALRGTRMAEGLAEALAAYRDTGDLSGLERSIEDRALLDVKRLARDNYDGIEPVIGYLLAKEYEAKAVRLIMVGKLNGLAREVIRERLRACYV